MLNLLLSDSSTIFWISETSISHPGDISWMYGRFSIRFSRTYPSGVISNPYCSASCLSNLHSAKDSRFFTKFLYLRPLVTGDTSISSAHPSGCRCWHLSCVESFSSALELCVFHLIIGSGGLLPESCLPAKPSTLAPRGRVGSNPDGCRSALQPPTTAVRASGRPGRSFPVLQVLSRLMHLGNFGQFVDFPLFL